MKNLKSSLDLILHWPQTSKWTCLKGQLTLLLTLGGEDIYWYLPSCYDSHSKGTNLFRLLRNGWSKWQC